MSQALKILPDSEEELNSTKCETYESTKLSPSFTGKYKFMSKGFEEH